MDTTKLKPYEFLGVEFQPVREGDKEAKAICPFCESMVDGKQKQSKFHVNLETGQYICSHCGESGNTYTYLNALYEEAKEATTNVDYKRLAQLRPGIQWTQARDSGVAQLYASPRPRWILPVRNGSSALVNYRCFDESDEKLGHALGIEGLPTHLFRATDFSAKGPIYVTEGEWDGVALNALFRKAKRKDCTVLSVPGANTFKREWVDTFQGREVYLLYDNDSPGIEGQNKAAFLLQGHAGLIHKIEWPAAVPDGYDISDYISERLSESHTPKRIIDDLHRMCVTHGGDTADINVITDEPPLVRNSFCSVLKDFKKYYHFDKNFEHALAISLSVIFSAQIKGDPLWMFLVGPPGTGKTLILKSTQTSPYVIFKTRIRATSLVSGYQTDDGSDRSLLLQLIGKCLTVKDFTAIMSMSFSDRESLYGLLRDIYDGRVDMHYGNLIGERTYKDCYFSMLAGVTDAIRNESRAELGERFLMYQVIDGTGYNPEDHIRAAISGMANEVEAERFLCRSVSAYTDREIALKSLPNPPTWLIDRTVALVQLVSFLRANSMVRGPGGDLAYRSAPEVPTRLAKQLIKLTRLLAFTLNKKTIDKPTYRIVEKVAFDTCRGWPLEILEALLQNNTPMTSVDLEDALDVPQTSLHRRLQSMAMLGVVTKNRHRSHRRGRPSNEYLPSDHLRQLWQTAKVGK